MRREILPTTAEIEDLLRRLPPPAMGPLPPASLLEWLHDGGLLRVAAMLIAAAVLTGLLGLSLFPPSALAIVFAEPGPHTLTQNNSVSLASQEPSTHRPAEQYCQVALSDLMQTVDRVGRLEIRRSISDIPIVASSQMIPEAPRAARPRPRAKRTTQTTQPAIPQPDTSPAPLIEKLFGWILPKNPGSNGA